MSHLGRFIKVADTHDAEVWHSDPNGTHDGHLINGTVEMAPRPDAKPAPILIDCEGGGYSGHRIASVELGEQLLCSMCGKRFDDGGTNKVPDHQREDVLTMLARGDYG